MTLRIPDTRMWTGAFKAILTISLCISASAMARMETISGETPERSAEWSANGGFTTIQLMPGVTNALGISLSGPPASRVSDMPGDLEFAVRDDAQLELWAPLGAWDGFASGGLRHSGRLSLSWQDGSLETDGFYLRAVSPDAFELVDNQGNSLFRLDYIHLMLYPKEQRMTMRNMDLSLTPWLAERIGRPELAGTVIAVAYTHTRLNIPSNALLEQAEGGGCVTPNWHDGVTFITDVELSNLGSVQQVAREANVRVAIAPSATLRNVGSADVPWVQKFTTGPGGTYPQPYNRDQHPFLVWAMYRVVDDIPQQIGQSAVKHAFFTVNGTCSCSGGSILWAAQNSSNGQACTDTYGVGNNNSPTHLGIREELPAFAGDFEQCGSMFAPGASPPGPCSQTVSGATGDDFERRLVVDEGELETDDAEYFFEGWYVIRDDVDIFNTMAHKSVTPTFGGSWSFPAGAHTLGPAIDAWVSADPDDQAPNEAHVRLATAEGHYSVAVKVTDLGGGMFRYVYALMNYDFDPRFNSFSLELPDNVTVENLQYLDGDKNGANDWTSSTKDGHLTWTAPMVGALEWGHMATFVFEANKAPVQSEVSVTGFEQAVESSVVVLGLDGFSDFFKHGFEQQSP